MADTQFKKGGRSGQASHNWQLVGSERVIGGYAYTKVSDRPNVAYTANWKPTHRLRWEAINGPLSAGMALKNLDGNRLNVEPSNWVAVPRALLPRLNGRSGRDFDNAPPELRAAILAVAKLEYAANEASGLTPVQRMIKKRKERQRAERSSTRHAGHAQAARARA